jgi:hypothetical protein
LAHYGRSANRKFIDFQWQLSLEESVFSYLQLKRVLSDVCRLLANDAGSLAINSGRKSRCLQVLWFIFAGRHSYVLKSLDQVQSFTPFFDKIKMYNQNCPKCGRKTQLMPCTHCGYRREINNKHENECAICPICSQSVKKKELKKHWHRIHEKEVIPEDKKNEFLAFERKIRRELGTAKERKARRKKEEMETQAEKARFDTLVHNIMCSNENMSLSDAIRFAKTLNNKNRTPNDESVGGSSIWTVSGGGGPGTGKRR